MNVFQLMTKTKRQSQSCHLRNEKPILRVVVESLEKTMVSGEDPDQMRCQKPRVVNGVGKRARVEIEAAPGDTTDTTEEVDLEVKCRVTDAPVRAQSQVLGGIVNPLGLPLPRETSAAASLDR